MIIIIVSLLLVLGLLFNALILNWVAKKFKAQDATYGKAIKISLIEWLADILIGVIVGIIWTNSIGNIIAWALGFVVFNLLCKKIYLTKIKQNIFIYLVMSLVVTLISLIIRTFIIQPFYISGTAMSPTLNNNDYIIIKMFNKSYERGDIIIHKDLKRNKDIFLKRIIGLPGEKIQIKGGVVYIYSDLLPSGQILNEPYLLSGLKTLSSDEDIITLGDDQYYVLGDNRENSKDSRLYGVVDEKLIIGKYWFTGIRNR